MIARLRVRLSLLLLLALGITCSRPSAGVGQDPPAAQLSRAPWDTAALDSAAVPAVYFSEWRRAANRTSCALIAPLSLGQGASAAPRAATFSGGWGVAYDLPDLRSAFGVAGAGARAADPSYAEWPYRREWRDGSTAGYGPEAGTGPNQLAYLRIRGEGCLYNVWSRLGRDHLEFLIGELRRVRVDR